MHAFENFLRTSPVLSTDQKKAFEQELLRQPASAESLLRGLVERGWLSKYQAAEIWEGRGPGLVLGSYILIDRVGQGGMGAVFKARNWKLDRIVAIKTIRPEKLGGPAMIRRFQREIRAAAALNHPNIVHALDADEVGGMHFFVMEYAEGIDLSKIVKTHGPLPIAAACECIRQAALGLQHAFENGMVHRDIKPGNLLLTTQDKKVKILDMGLVRMDASEHSQSGTMTGEGAVMGTPDYIAPEQALDSHVVDIRADLYSLGCTFFYLLTGKPPFPGGTMMQKLMRHANEPPPEVESLRPEVPGNITAIVQRLLLKDPEDRFQTPAELAEAIAAVQYQPESLPSVAQMAFEVEQTQADSPFDRIDESVSQPTSIPAALPVETRSRKPMWIGGSVVLAALIGVGVWQATRESKKPEEARKEIVENEQPPIGVKKKDDDKEKSKPKDPIAILPTGPANDEWVAAVQLLSAEEQAKAVFAKLAELNESFDAAHKGNTFELVKGSVHYFCIQGQAVTDISPVRAIKNLQYLICRPLALQRGPNCAVVSLADLTPLRDLKLSYLYVEGNRVEDLSPIKDMPLINLRLNGTRVKDLSPLKNMKTLQLLNLQSTDVNDLKPLADLKISELILDNTDVDDASPLARLPLRRLNLRNTRVSDATHLGIESLQELVISGCPIRSDLTPLEKCKQLRSLEMYGDPAIFDGTIPIRAFDAKKFTSLRHVWLSVGPRVDPLDQLKQLPNLETINGQPAAEFWKIMNPDPEQEKWEKRFAVMPTANQRVGVTERMEQLHPGIKGKIEFTVQDNAVAKVHTDSCSDLRFLRPLTKLQHLTLQGRTGALQPLTPLPIRHLATLKSDVCLSGLAELPLEYLHLGGNLLDDLKQLSSTKSLRTLELVGSVARVAPLAKLSLQRLTIHNSSPRDLDLLKEMKTLEEIDLAYDDVRHRDALKAMTWLKKINGKTPDEFWKEIAEQQVEFVRREMKRLNGEVTRFEYKIVNGEVSELLLDCKSLLNLGPVASLRQLRKLSCMGADGNSLVSLMPLRALPLAELTIYGALPSQLEALNDCPIAILTFRNSSIRDLAGLRIATLRNLSVANCTLYSDLSALQGMPLESLYLHQTQVKDLSPLKGMPLKQFHHVFDGPLTQVPDLEALRNMPLTNLNMNSRLVKDLSPLRDCKSLNYLQIEFPQAKDLSPLEGLPLESLHLFRMYPSDLKPLQKSPLKMINMYMTYGNNFTYEPFRGDAEVLRAIPTLQSINGKNAKEFLKEADDKMAAFQKWCDEVAKLPPKEQVKKVAEELKKRNPEMNGTASHRQTGNQVTALTLTSVVGITDIAPIRALRHLKHLHFNDSTVAGSLTNLYPLKGMNLESFFCAKSGVSDLDALRGMKSLRLLMVNNCPVTDLEALRGLELTDLHCGWTRVVELAPLARMKLNTLILTQSPIRDLSPLRGMPLRSLSIQNTQVSDLSPLKGMPLEFLGAMGRIDDYRIVLDLPELKDLNFAFVPWRDSAIIRSLKKLEKANLKPAKEYHAWADWEDAVRKSPPKDQIEMLKAKLIELNGPGTDVSKVAAGPLAKGETEITVLHCYGDFKDISPVRAIPGVRLLYLGQGLASGKKSILADITPLQGLKLKKLSLCGAAVTDLSPLRGMELEWLVLSASEVADLTPLKGMPLKELHARTNKISNLEPLRGMKLEVLDIAYGNVSDLEPLRGMPLIDLHVAVNPAIKSIEPLTGMKLKRLHLYATMVTDLSVLKGMPLEEFRPSGGARDFAPLKGAPIRILDMSEHKGPLEWTPLHGIPLEDYKGAVESKATLHFLKSCRQTLKKINGKPAVEFWPPFDKEQADFDTWAKKVAALKPDEQVQEVLAELQRRNPKFVDIGMDKVSHAIENNAVTSLVIPAKNITDLSPIRALPHLKSFSCIRWGTGWESVTDLWPLTGLKLEELWINGNDVQDLAPLRDMPLKKLNIGYSKVEDLKILENMPLVVLQIQETSVKDLAHLRHIKSLRELRMINTNVKEISPLLDLALENIEVDFQPKRDALILRQIKTLKTINGKPAAEVLNAVEKK